MAVITDNFTLPDFSGDAGSGGTHGLVPAPAAGDGTDKYLKADGTWSSTPEIQEDPGAGVGLIEANPPGGPTVLKNVRDGQGTRVIANTGSFQTDVHFSAPDVAFVSDALGDPTEVPVAETSGSEVIVRALPTGKIDLSFIPDSILGQVEYQGVWNASTNTPTLANPPASTTKGDFYIANVAGTQFGISFGVGDWIISDGTAWSKVDNTDVVSSVFGRIGAVLATLGDYAASLITNDSVQAGATVKSVLDALTTLAFVTPGTGVAAALAQAINTASGFITQTGGDARYALLAPPSFIAYTGGSVATTSTSFANVHASASLTVPAAGFYEFQFLVTYQSAATTTGARFGVNGTMANSYLAATCSYSAGLAGRGASPIRDYDAGGAVASSFAASADIPAVLTGFAQFSGAGTLSLRFATSVGGSAITVTALTGFLRKQN